MAPAPAAQPATAPAAHGAAPATPKRASAIARGLASPLAKPLLLVLALLPLASLLWGAATNTLGANPAEALIRGSGDWTLRLLCLTLTITPLRQATGWHTLLRFRRMLGLLTFFYGVLHFLCFAWLDMGLDLTAIVRDITKRPFILVGSAALLSMLPLAATSFNRAIKTLGAQRWQALHRTVYATAVLALLHFLWMRSGKNDFAEVAVYGAILGGLLGWRLWRWWDRRTGAPAPHEKQKGSGPGL